MPDLKKMQKTNKIVEVKLERMLLGLYNAQEEAVKSRWSQHYKLLFESWKYNQLNVTYRALSLPHMIYWIEVQPCKEHTSGY